ncbi:MAG: hypothetical protein QOF16_1580 [Actinomycetota bacterium]|nr:hypothetical protein [Actinomycetota bacterium]MEA2487926.1 hypothetical protein [Actinomycetota bacterium]
MDEDKELAELRAQVRADRKLIRKAADALAEIDRGPGLSDVHADVLAALRIRLEGKKRASLEELLEAAGDISGKKDLSAVLEAPTEDKAPEWPVVEEKKKDWPGL